MTKASATTYRRLEGAEQVTDEGMFAPQRQHFSLNHGALDVVIFQHHVLLEALDRIVLRLSAHHAGGAAQLSQDHLAKGSLAEHLEKVEVFHTVLAERRPTAKNNPLSRSIVRYFATPNLPTCNYLLLEACSFLLGCRLFPEADDEFTDGAAAAASKTSSSPSSSSSELEQTLLAEP